MIRTYWETVFRAQSFKKKKKVIPQQQPQTHPHAPPRPRPPQKSGERREERWQSAFALGRKKSCLLAPVHRTVNR